MREKTKIKVSSYNIASIVTTNESEEEKRKKIEKVWEWENHAMSIILWDMLPKIPPLLSPFGYDVAHFDLVF